jgi:hypothetical protein
MTVKIATCVGALALLAGTATFSAPAAAQSRQMAPSHARMSPNHDKRLFLSAVAVYDAGLRRGRANSSRNAYLRGFRDGTSSEAYNVQAYVANPYAAYQVAPSGGYSLYDRAGGYAPVAGTYAPYYGARAVSYDGFASDRYDAGYAAPGLMNVAVTPVAMAPSVDLRAAHWSYCTARYQSFDPASDTFLALDGNRYYCR